MVDRERHLMSLGRDGHGYKGAIGVGIVGAGVVTQAVHIPTLERLVDTFCIRSIYDPDVSKAQHVAGHLGIEASSDFEQLLADSSVEVVAILSPAAFHAGQALAAMQAGKKAVLVEKPLCQSVDEAERLAAAAIQTGAALLVGAMHAYDPAWIAAQSELPAASLSPTLIRSNIVLPPNGQFEACASEVFLTQERPAVTHSPEVLMRLHILELAVHDLPLVRRLLTDGVRPRVVMARILSPMGYAITLEAGDVLVELFAFIHEHWQTDWTLEATGRLAHLRLCFTPSFVSAGSGTMSLSRDGRVVRHDASPENGYFSEWREMARIVRGEKPPPDPNQHLADYRFVLDIAEQASSLLFNVGQ
jgi:myo-inositol 2-dehydrogenase / D-chiro-inositol 1-dehydrogenase